MVIDAVTGNLVARLIGIEEQEHLI